MDDFKNVVVSAEVLIRLNEVERFDVFERLEKYRFHITAMTREAVKDPRRPEQSKRIDEVLAKGFLHEVEITADEATQFAEFVDSRRPALSSSVAVAILRNWKLLSDQTSKLARATRGRIRSRRIMRSDMLLAMVDKPETCVAEMAS